MARRPGGAREQLGLLRSAQICRNRDAVGLQLATHLGLAKAPLSRWETGAQVQERALDWMLRLYFSSPSVHIAQLDDDRLAEPGAAISPRPESDRQAESDSWPIADWGPAFGELLRALTRHVSSKAGRWFIAPLSPVQAEDAEQADRLSRLAGVLDSLPEAKRASAVEGFQQLMEVMK